MSAGPVRFPDDAVAAICRHMDEDHADDALLIVRTLGGRPDAVRVRTTGVDGAGLDLEVLEPERALVRVPFPAPVTERAEVRHAVVALHAQARAAAGVRA